MRREKRRAQVRANIPEYLKEQIDIVVAESNVTTISDYLLDLIERDLEEKAREANKHMRISQQRLSARTGRN